MRQADREHRLHVMADRRERERRRAIDYIRWTDPQRAFLAERAPAAIIWGANQIGKSWVLAADAILFLRGEHPYDQTHRPPVRVLVLGDRWSAMVPLIRRLWSFIDPAQFGGKLRFEGGQIRGQKYAVYRVQSGPGEGSELILATYREGAQRIAGETVHRVITDEPMPDAIYGEIVPRLQRFGGHLRLGFTPTLGTYEGVQFIWDLVERGLIVEHQVVLTPEAVTPRGGLLEVPLITASQIAETEARYLPMERDMRMGRSRVPLATDRVLSGWGEHLISADGPPLGAVVSVGIDHGSGAGRQRAVVVAIHPDLYEPEVWVLGEVYSDGRTTPKQDAAAIRDMLLEVGLRLEDVDYWYGDRAHAGDRFGGSKSNGKLLRAFTELLRVGRSQLPAPLRLLRVPTKGPDSVWDGCRALNAIMLSERLHVHPRTVHLQHDIATWRGSTIAPEKDGVDALRYATIPPLDRIVRRRGVA